MIPVDMLCLHDPQQGIYGDCQRACIASLLELNPKDIPHFYESGNDLIFWKSLNGFLAEHALLHLQVEAFNFGMGIFKGHADCYHMIYGNSCRNTLHAVVGLNGVIVHDPHPSRAGLLPDNKETPWFFAFLVKAKPKHRAAIVKAAFIEHL